MDGDSLASACEENSNKMPGGSGKIQRTVSSMMKQMEMSEEEIKYRMENFDDADIGKQYIKYLKCTRCSLNFQNIINRGLSVGVHPLLGVLLCDSCCDYYGDGNFSLDSEGEDKYCRWCGQGGTIFACSKCICGFCEECIKKHFGKHTLEEVKNDDDWVCYFCDPRPLWYLRSICSLAKAASKSKREHLESTRERRLKKLDGLISNSSDSCSSTPDSIKLKRKRFSKQKVNIKQDSSSSSDEEAENQMNSRNKRKSIRKKSLGKTGTEESSGSDERNPKKKARVSEEKPEDPELESIRKPLIEKLKSIWKLTQTATEIGVKSSKEKLNCLSRGIDFDSIESLRKEREELRSCISVLVSTLGVAANSADSIGEDLKFDTAKDEREIFQTQETELKRFAKKLRDGSTVEASDHSPAGEEIEGKKRNKKEKKKSIKEERKSTDDEEGANGSVPGSDESDKEGSKKRRSPAKPLLKVKSFARMLDENAYDKNKKLSVNGNFKTSEKAPVVIDLYDIDTDESESEQLKKKESTKSSADSEKKTSRRHSARSLNQKNLRNDTTKSDDEDSDGRRKTRKKKNKENKQSSDEEESEGKRKTRKKNNRKKEKTQSSDDEESGGKRNTRQKKSVEDLKQSTEEEQLEKEGKTMKKKSPKDKKNSSDNETQDEDNKEQMAKKKKRGRKPSRKNTAAEKSESEAEEIKEKEEKIETHEEKIEEAAEAEKETEQEIATVENLKEKSPEEENENAGRSDEEKMSDEKKESKSSGKEESKNSDKEESKNSDKEESKNSDKEESKNSDKEESKNSDKEESKNSDKEESKNSDKEESKNSDKEESKNSDKEESKNSDKKESKNSEKNTKTNSSEENSSDSTEKKLRRITRKQKKEKTELKASFEEYKQKREKFLKSAKESSQEKEKKKVNELDSSDEENESQGKGGKQKKKRVLTSSDEEGGKRSERSDNDNENANENEEVESEKENQKSDPDSKTMSSGETSSDEMSSKHMKKKKRGRKEKSSDSEERDTKKRRRKKKKSSSDSSGDDKKKKQGRRNIKKILKKDSLKVETKEALKNEEERKKRLKERHKLFEENFPQKDEMPLKHLILDFDPETKEPLVTVHKKLVKKLKPHQAKGVRFMWDNCFESVQRMEEDSGSGCILAHCMGLGKTLQVITLVHTVMSHELGVNSVLIVCPLSTVSNWIREFETWLANIHTEPITLYEIVKYKKLEDRKFYLKDWHQSGGVLVISYDLFRNMTKAAGKKKKSKTQKIFESALLDPGPDLVICDEGHLLKNEDTALSKCMSQIKTSRRIVLTGTPLQNNLIEYHCMVQFVKPNILGTKKEFCNRFVNPISNGQFEDSTEFDVKIMKRRSHVLHSMLDGCIQRFDYSVLTPFLPEKHEYVLSISLTETQAKVYQHFISNLSAKSSGNARTASLFNDYHSLQRIWTHPRTLLMQSEKESMKEENDSEGSLKDFVVSSDEESVSSKSDSSDSSPVEVIPKKRITRSTANDPEVIEAQEKEDMAAKKKWWDEFYNEDAYEDLRESNKLVLLFDLLKHCNEVNDKVLVFSQSLYSLDLIEYFLGKVDANKSSDNEELCGHKDRWVAGTDYFRLDGSTTSEKRAIWCSYFNKESNTRARLFLLSTKAGGLGINLYGANRVVIFDASWNPSHDLQSIFRVYRFGQKKTCYVYRFLSEATMEEKIYERQVTKLSLAHRVVDEHQIERHYTMGNLQGLYTFEPTPKEARKVPKLPKDAVLADLLAAHKDMIVKYHEHDSLLENKQEEELSEEERKAAWKEYEEEKVQKSYNLDPIAQQQYLLMMQQARLAQGATGAQNMPTMYINPATATQPMINPMFIQANPSIPLAIHQRGLKVGLTPGANESLESFFMRILNRESWLMSGGQPQ